MSRNGTHIVTCESHTTSLSKRDVAQTLSARIQVWDAASGHKIGSSWITDLPEHIILSNDGSRIITFRYPLILSWTTNGVQLNASSLSTFDSFQSKNRVTVAASFSLTGDYVVSAHMGADDLVLLWRETPFGIVAMDKSASQTLCLCFSHDGTCIARAATSGSISIITWADPSRTDFTIRKLHSALRFQHPSRDEQQINPIAIAFSPDDSSLVSVSNRAVCMFDPKGDYLRTFSLDSWGSWINADKDNRIVKVQCVGFSLDGSILFLCTEDAVFCLSSRTMRPIRQVIKPPLANRLCVAAQQHGIQFVSIAPENGMVSWTSQLAQYASQVLSHSSRTTPIDLSGRMIKINHYPVGSGGFGDVFQGKWKTPEEWLYEPPHVAIKVVRASVTFGVGSEAFTRRLNREIRLWSLLKHNNVVPFVGVSGDFGSLLSPLSIWMPNGTVKSFLAKFPDANRREIVLGAARGLHYLHSHDPQVVHGDVKPLNILVDNTGAPRLTDFGLSVVLDSETFWNSTRTSADGTLRYMSPELMNGEQPTPSVPGDVYAFAMTALEIMTGEAPFQTKYPRNEAAMAAVLLRDERPDKPHVSTIADDMWSEWQTWWATKPEERPRMAPVVQSLESWSADYRPLRILSIDNCGLYVASCLQYLQRIAQFLPYGEKPCNYFDLIVGSGAGGVIAAMLGRLRMSLEECLAELYSFSVFLSQTAKVSEPFSSTILSPNTEGYLAEMVSGYNRGETPYLENWDPRYCRTMIIGASWGTSKTTHLRSYASDLTGTPPIHVTTAIQAALLSFGEEAPTNPSLEAYVETHLLFGGARRIGCFVSIGRPSTTHKRNVTPEPSGPRLGSSLPSGHHDSLDGMLDPRAYFRFDMGDVSDMTDEKLDVSEFTDPDVLHHLRTIKSSARDYMNKAEQIQSTERCAARLQYVMS